MQSKLDGRITPEPMPPAKGKHAGTVPVLYQKLIQKRQDVGWSQRTLAKRSFCSLTTVKSIENGNDAFPSTIEKVCKPLGLKLADLTIGAEQCAERPSDLTSKREVYVKIFLKADFDRFDESKIGRVIQQLRTDHGVEGEIVVVVVEKGSIVVKLKMEESDALVLLKMLENQDIEDFPKVVSLGIRAVDIGGTDDISPEAKDAIYLLANSEASRFRHFFMDINAYFVISRAYPYIYRSVSVINSFLVKVFGTRHYSKTYIFAKRLVAYIMFLAHMTRVCSTLYAAFSPVYIVERYTRRLENQMILKDGIQPLDKLSAIFFWSVIVTNLINLILLRVEDDRFFRSIVIASLFVNMLFFIFYYI